MSIKTKITGALCALFFCLGAMGTAQAQNCELTPSLKDNAKSSTGRTSAAGPGDRIPLKLVYEGCEALDRIEITLPDELEVLDSSGGCSITNQGLKCSGLANEAKAPEQKHVVDAVLQVADDLEPGDSGQIFAEWEARAFPAGKKAALGSGDSGAIITSEGGYWVMAAELEILTPLQGQVITVSPGEDFTIFGSFAHRPTPNNVRVLSQMYLPFFTANGASNVNPPDTSCLPENGSIHCGANSSISYVTHSASFVWTAPTTPGTYSGTYQAQACDNFAETNCPIEHGHTFTVVVEDLSCDVGIGNAVRVSPPSHRDITVNSPFSYDVTVSAPAGNGVPAGGIVLTGNFGGGASFVSGSGSGWSCSSTGPSQFSCSYNQDLAAGQSATVTLDAMAGDTAGQYQLNLNPSSDNCSGSGSQTPYEVFEEGDEANIDSSKSGPDEVTEGEEFDWVININQGGPDPAQDFVLTDNLPSGVSLVGVSADSPLSCTNSGQQITCSADPLPMGSYNVTITARADSPGSYTNICAASSSSDGRRGNEGCEHTVIVNELPPDEADMVLTKTGPATVLAGEPIVYDLSVANWGPDTANNVMVIDTLPAQVTYDSYSGTFWNCQPNGAGSGVTCSRLSALASGGNAGVLEISAIAPDEPGTVENCATVYATEADPNQYNNNDCHITEVLANADLSVSKTSSEPVVLAGEPYSYTITISNDGPSTAEDVVVTDPLPAGVTYVSHSGPNEFLCGYTGQVVTCSAAQLPIGSYDIHINVLAPTVPGTITNACVVEADSHDPNPIAPEDCEVDTEVIDAANLRVSKSMSPSPVLAGEPVTYTIELTNQGPNAAEDVVISDTLPAGMVFQSVNADSPLTCSGSSSLTCVADTLPVGDYSIVISALAPTDPGPITNICVVDSETADPDPIGPNECRSDDEVDPAAHFELEKTASSDTVLAGSDFTYEIAIRNTGPNQAESVTITDPLPQGVVFQSAVDSEGLLDCSHSGGQLVCDAALFPVTETLVTIEVTAPDEPGEITNICVLESDTEDPNPPGDGECRVVTDVEPAAHLSADKSASVSEIHAGGEFIYTLAVSNTGPNPAENLLFTDELPDGVTVDAIYANPALDCAEQGGVVSCSAVGGELAIGHYEVDLEVTAPDDPGTIINTCVAWSDTEPNTSADPAHCPDVPVEILPVADLRVEKTTLTSPIYAGQELIYRIELSNLGPHGASDVTMHDPLPAGTEYVSVTASDSAFACTYSPIGGYGSGTVDCSAATLPVGDYYIDIELKAPEEVGAIVNECVIDASSHDPTPIGDGMCRVDDDVDPIADLELTKFAATAPGMLPSSGTPIEIPAGSVMYWRINFTNNGPSDAEDVVIRDTIPEEFEVEHAFVNNFEGTYFDCSTSGNEVECDIGDVPAGSTGEITIQVLAPDQGGDFTNVCTFSADTELVEPISSCEGDVTITPQADLAVNIEAYDDPDAYLVDPASASPVTTLDAGAEALYQIHVVNHGPSDAEMVDLVTELDSQFTDLEIVGATPPECSIAGNSLVCAMDELDVGDSYTALVKLRAPEADVDLVSTAQVSADTEDPDLSNNEDEHTLDVQETPIIGLAKAQTQVEHLGNGEFEASLVFTLINYGNVPLRDVQVYDDLTATFPSHVPWTVSDLSVEGDLTAVRSSYNGDTENAMLSGDETLPVDGEAFIRLKVQFIPGSEPGPFWNQADSLGWSTLDAETTDLSTNGMDPNPDNTHPGNWSDPTPIQYDEDPAIGLAKWVESQEYTGNGQQRIDLAILVENWGNTPLSDMQITDDLAYAFTADSFIQKYGRLAASNNLDSVFDEVVDITIDGDLNGLNPSFDGINDINLLDGSDTLPVGGSAVVRFGVIFSPTDEDYGPYFNRAIGTGLSPSQTMVEDYSQEGMNTNPSDSGDPTDDSDPTEMWALHSDIESTKTWVNIDAGTGDLIEWLVTVTNNGPDEAHDVVMVDTLPGSVTFNSVSIVDGPVDSCDEQGGVITCTASELAVGQSVVIEITAWAPDTEQTIINVCEAESDMPDSDTDNNACESEVYVGPKAALSVSKTAAPDPVLAGETLTYTITVVNDGPEVAENVTVDDLLPAGTEFVAVSSDAPLSCGEADGLVECHAPSLPVGTYSIIIDVVAPLEPGRITNICVVNSDTDNPTPIAPGDCQVDTDVDPAARLEVSKYPSVDAVGVGRIFDFIIAVENHGPNPAEDVVVIDDLPPELTFVGIEADAPFVCSEVGGQITCQADELQVGGPYLMTITVRAPDTEGTVRNICAVDSATGTPDPLVPADCDSGDIDVLPPGTIAISKRAESSNVAPGEVFAWIIELEQMGPGDVEDVVIVDDVPPPLVVTGADATAPLSCSQNGNEVTCSADALEQGSYEIRVLTRAPAEPGPVSNTCVLEADNDGRVDGDCDGDITVDEITTLNVTAAADRSSVYVGEDWTYTVHLTNDGLLTAQNVELSLNHSGSGEPNGGASTGAESCLNGISGGQSSCLLPTLEPGEGVTLHLPMTATEVGQHALFAHGLSTTPLTPNSRLQDDAGVQVIEEPFGPNGPIPVPTNSRVGLSVFVLLMLALGFGAIRATGRLN